MSQPANQKKFKKNVREYMEGHWFSEWEGIKNVAETRQNLKIVANARDKRDFSIFITEKGAETANFRLELIQGTKNHYSIRTGGQWRIFFVWENNEAWEIEISKHDYKKVKRGK